MEPMDVDRRAAASRAFAPATPQVFRNVNTASMPHGTQSPFQPTPAARPSPAHFKSQSTAAPFTRTQAPPPMASPPSLNLAALPAIPDSLPNLTPSYPAALFGGLSADDEHVTVWEPATGKTVAGNAAPYRRNLTQWLQTHQGWEEKADELKSSKRRAAARRSKTAATNFAALCAFPVAKCLAKDALRKFRDANVETPVKSLSEWSPEDYVRLQEILFRVAQEAHSKCANHELPNLQVPLAPDCWKRVAQHVGANKRKTDVVYLAHHILEFGIQKSMHELSVAAANRQSSATGAIGIPARSDSSLAMHSPGAQSIGSVDGWRGPRSFGANSLPSMASGGLSAITNSFRTPKEPRITVWHPDTGKTISGNAAPCRRNLDTWMAQHPGWVPKSETQLSSARRSRNKKSRPMSVPNTGAIAISGGSSSLGGGGQSPFFDAVQGLLGLGVSAGSYNSSSGVLCGGGIGKRPRTTAAGGKKGAVTSSISSSSGGENDSDSSDDEDKMEM